MENGRVRYGNGISGTGYLVLGMEYEKWKPQNGCVWYVESGTEYAGIGHENLAQGIWNVMYWQSEMGIENK